MKAIPIALAFIAGTALAAVAETDAGGHAMTAGDLAGLCQSTDTTSKNACRVYILGVTQGIQVGMDIADGKTKGGRPCIPDDISGESLEIAVKMQLGQDLMMFPADRELYASGFVGAALLTTFPCSKART